MSGKRLTFLKHFARLTPALLKPGPPSFGFSPWRINNTLLGYGRFRIPSWSETSLEPLEEGTESAPAELSSSARRAVVAGKSIRREEEWARAGLGAKWVRHKAGQDALRARSERGRRAGLGGEGWNEGMGLETSLS